MNRLAANKHIFPNVFPANMMMEAFRHNEQPNKSRHQIETNWPGLQHVAPHSSSGSESTVGLRGGSGSESEDTKALSSSLGMVPLDSDELTGEASGEPAPRGMGPYTSSNSESEDIRTGHTHQGGLLNELSAAETLSFSTDVSDTRRQRKKQKLRKSRNPGQGR